MFRNVLVKTVLYSSSKLGSGPTSVSAPAKAAETWVKTCFGSCRLMTLNSSERDSGKVGNYGRKGYWRKYQKTPPPPPPPNSNEFLKLLGGGGVSLGFLGFFEKEEEEEMTVEDTVLLYIKKAILAVQRDNLELAEENLVNALRLSHENKLEEAKTQIFDMQANLAFQKQDFERAEMLFKVTAQRLVNHQNYASNHNAIVEISLKLAQIYANRGLRDQAITGYQYCIDAQRSKIERVDGDEDEDTLLLAAWAMHSLAQLHLTLGAQGNTDKKKIEETADLIKDAYKYASRALGPDSEQAVSIQSDLASTLALTGDFDGALRKLLEVETIARDKHESLYPHIRVNIGNVYLQKGSYLEAERVCVDARTFAKKVKNLEAFARAEECLLASTKARASESAKA